MNLKSDIHKIDSYESSLDAHISWMEQSIKNVTHDPEKKKYLYTTSEDFRRCYDQENHVVTMEMPLKTNIQYQVVLYDASSAV